MYTYIYIYTSLSLSSIYTTSLSHAIYSQAAELSKALSSAAEQKRGIHIIYYICIYILPMSLASTPSVFVSG